MTTPLTDNSFMPYGKYKNKRMAEVPADYLFYLLENDKCSEPVRQYITANREAIQERGYKEAFKPRRSILGGVATNPSGYARRKMQNAAAIERERELTRKRYPKK